MEYAPHLHQGVADKTKRETAANRDGYGEGLVAAAREDARIVALSADLAGSTRTRAFADEFPERFVQCGIAEQNMASVASGLAAVGKIPFIASYAMFSPGRSWEQVRTTIAYNNQNVKIIGAHAGVSVGPDGATHQAIEDIALMRVVPHMVVLAPADKEEARKAVLWAAAHNGPVYIRLAREATPCVTTADTPFAVPRALELARSSARAPHIALLTTGVLAQETLQAATALAADGYAVSVHHFPAIKPLDTDTLTALQETAALFATIEEHQRAGGFGSAVAERVSASPAPRPVLRIGIHDAFGQSGTPAELFSHYEISAPHIEAHIRNWCHKNGLTP